MCVSLNTCSASRTRKRSRISSSPFCDSDNAAPATAMLAITAHGSTKFTALPRLNGTLLLSSSMHDRGRRKRRETSDNGSMALFFTSELFYAD